MHAHKRMSAEQAANYAFIMSCRAWSGYIEFVGDIAPVLEHMLPGDVRDLESHELIRQTLTGALREDWALELIGIGSMIKYPFAVEICLGLTGRLRPPDPGPGYTAEELVVVLLEAVVRVAALARPGARFASGVAGKWRPWMPRAFAVFRASHPSS